jgi:hypothetical protein
VAARVELAHSANLVIDATSGERALHQGNHRFLGHVEPPRSL